MHVSREVSESGFALVLAAAEGLVAAAAAAPADSCPHEAAARHHAETTRTDEADNPSVRHATESPATATDTGTVATAGAHAVLVDPPWAEPVQEDKRAYDAHEPTLGTDLGGMDTQRKVGDSRALLQALLGACGDACGDLHRARRIAVDCASPPDVGVHGAAASAGFGFSGLVIYCHLR
ncbi:unnamed protein product [Polarella glacialis]|uniref:Uncharacterized protein n=1 Tax=Polarella glacialis TaxID=89957 RepID=A0A813J704_POLGL|nr:unnamed protein product [Polarella glacialis]CAE8674950.1 unnamed protein product [Polarella glacialis]